MHRYDSTLVFVALACSASLAGGGDGDKKSKVPENCTNAVDDNGNDLIDCNDADCAGTSQCPAGCGNGKIDAGEACDGAALRDKTCMTQDFDAGTLRCNRDCTGFDTSGCTGGVRCDNDVKQTGEECDGKDLGGKDCRAVGYGAGTLACAPGCTFDTRGCSQLSTCSDGSAIGPEYCDGPDFDVVQTNVGPLPLSDCRVFGMGNGTISCLPNCVMDFAGCEAPDYCQVRKWYGNGVCDPCEKLGGHADDDCNKCTEGNGCVDTFNSFVNEWTCVVAVGERDPDCGTCGDGKQEKNEQCDGVDLGPKKPTCHSREPQFGGGTLGCTKNCVFDYSGCRVGKCGNGVIDITPANELELCDKEAFAEGLDCTSVGIQIGVYFVGGNLACSEGCIPDLSGCVAAPMPDFSPFCGDGDASGPEPCDDKSFDGGTRNCVDLDLGEGELRCNTDCTLNYSGCRIQDSCSLPSAFDPQQTRATDKMCDACLLLGGQIDAACAAHCGQDGLCADQFDPKLRVFTCEATLGEGKRDPDCGKCGNGVVEAPEQCDGNPSLGGKTCSDVEPGFIAGQGSLACTDKCTYDFSDCKAPTCGDNIIEGDEVCDGTNLAGKACADYPPLESGNLHCSPTCDGYDTRECGKAGCGNDYIDVDEECDKTALPAGKSCATEQPGSYGGVLTCNANCTLSSDGCARCGDHAVNGLELCDGDQFAPGFPRDCSEHGLGAGNITCNVDCTPSLRDCSGPADYCGALGWYGDGICDLCAEYPNGKRDPDCLLCGAADNNCPTYFDEAKNDWTCMVSDPDCKCGDGVVGDLEYCDKEAVPLDCDLFGLSDGTSASAVTCGPYCVPDLSQCLKPSGGNSTREGFEECDGTDLGKDAFGETTSCRSFMLEGTLACSSCAFDKSGCRAPVCGNGTLEVGEWCDGGQFISDPQSSPITCDTFGFAGGTLGCTPKCTVDIAGCNLDTCGNGHIDAYEQCDGANLNRRECEQLGFESGTLACTASCQLDLSGCVAPVCGDGAAVRYEVCDGEKWGFAGGPACRDFNFGNLAPLTCGADCTLRTIDRRICGDNGDVCQAAGWYGDGGCDPCHELGGRPDVDCIVHCRLDGVCADRFDPTVGHMSCPMPDPDCDSTCGNDVIEAGLEMCDGTALGGWSCVDFGFTSGELRCAKNCTFDFGACL